MNISELYARYKQHPVVTTDSRSCPTGSIFFALKGKSSDGNMYAENALRAGCSYAVIDNPSAKTDKRMILVENVLGALQQLAALHRQTLGVPVIGITGTNGKTTTKELLSAVLSKKYKTLYTQGNLNNHIGVPLTLLRLTGEHEIAVIEMGANHPGEIRELANIARPDYGLITNAGRAHLEGFGSLEGVLKTKGELYGFLRETNGKLFINRDHGYLMNMAEGMEQITYGELDKGKSATENPASGPIAGSGKSLPFVGGCILNNSPYLSFQWRQQEKSIHTIETHLIGHYNFRNALAAIAAGLYFNVPPEQIDQAIASYEPDNNRSQLKQTTHNTLIIDAYNANPDSMKLALENFAALNVSPKAVILGDMLELGENSPRLHKEIIQQVRNCKFEKVLLCGGFFTEAGHGYICFPKVEELVEYLRKEPLKGFYILIKGSRGLRLEETTGLL